jgi:hypothetical protein
MDPNRKTMMNKEPNNNQRLSMMFSQPRSWSINFYGYSPISTTKIVQQQRGKNRYKMFPD